MKSKFISVSIVKSFLVAGCLLINVACNQNTDTTANADTEEEAEPTFEPLTKENAEEVLTAYAQKHPDSLAVISTRHGDIKVRLFKDTPMHRANFVRLTKAGFYNQGEFYRVVKDFAIQGGDSDQREMQQGGYKIPQEFNPKYIHKRGALAMARYGDERNPEKESSSHNFYIVTGQPVTEEQLHAYEDQHNVKYTPEQIQTYLEVGGEPGLDTEYTVFGEVVEGMEAVEKIQQEPVDGTNWPRRVVPHTIQIVKE